VRAEKNARSIKQIAEQTFSKMQAPVLAKTATIAAIANLVATMPAQAAEAGKIFDFNLTLPIMATQFLLLMVFLEKTWFTPVGNVLDERDRVLREKLSSVKDNSSELEALQKEAEDIIDKARKEASAAIQAAKQASEEDIQKAADEHKKQMDKELEAALATLQKEQSAALGDVDAKVSKLVDEVLNRVLPDSVKV
jgi:F-type H+-transporting ATPase subunit b